jgi:hypothetical protein
MSDNEGCQIPLLWRISQTVLLVTTRAHIMPISICKRYPDTPPKQQALVVSPYRLPQINHHEGRHS